MTTDELRAAADRCRGLADPGWVDVENAPPECVADLLTLARAWLAEHPGDDAEPVTWEFLEGLGFTPAPSHPNRYLDVRVEFAVEREADGVTLRVWPQVRSGKVGQPPAPVSAFGVFVAVEDRYSSVLLPGTYPTRGHVRRLLKALSSEDT